MSSGVKNLFEIIRACGAMEAHDSLMTDYTNGSLRYSDLKEATANALLELINPFRLRLAELNADKRNVKDQIQDSSAVIRQRAQRTMKEVRELTGLGSLRG